MSLHAFVYPHRGVLPDEEEMKTFDSPALTPQEKSVHEHVLPVAEFRDEPEWEAGELEEDSPYPEVRSAVSNTDDPDMPCNTFRAWVLGLLWAIIIPGVNQFFFFRYPSVPITGLVPQLLAFPLGRAWARFFPRWRLFGISLNPGPFTVKEHVLVTIMASVGSQSAYATDIVAVQRVYYNQTWDFAYQWLVVMSTQLIGFSIGGIARRFLVAPPSMIWPANLVQCALFNTLHSQAYEGMGRRGGLSRERFFVYAFGASFVWYFVPGYLFTALSAFNWVCWIAPDNVKVNQMFGYYTGMGMSLVTFDWAQVAYIGSPLVSPWWATANIATGFVVIFWILTPILYYTNTWSAQYLPISSTISFNRHGTKYDVRRILTESNTLDPAAYAQYSPLFLSTTFALAYGLSLASITATVAHAWLYFRSVIALQARRSLSEQPDVHARLMARYPEVPQWWYGAVFCTMFAFGASAIELWDTKFPVWAFVLSLMIAFVYIIPVGMIQAITNQQVGLNVITELVVGYALPGRPVAMMLFKTWGYITMSQALTFSADMKLGHYMKLPPRAMFAGQVAAAALAGTVQLGVQAWLFANVPDVCEPTQKNGFVCRGTHVFGTASVVWGVIGPGRLFAKESPYHPLLYFFVLGALCPVIAWALGRRWPDSPVKYVNFPVVFTGLAAIPPASAVNYVPWAIVGFVFQYLIRRRHFSWWTKYNYVLSAALDTGYATAAILIFFVLQFPRGGDIGEHSVQTWWGNRVSTRTADYRMTPLRRLAEGEWFGPETWK